jgi:hypothetical protein
MKKNWKLYGKRPPEKGTTFNTVFVVPEMNIIVSMTTEAWHRNIKFNEHIDQDCCS